MNILIVCVGNICRSPMAEYLLKERLKKTNKQHQVSSAGLAAVVGAPVQEIANKLLVEQKIDALPHVAKQLTPDMVANADLILVMDKAQKYNIQQVDPSSCGKVHLLGEWRDGLVIPDPYKKDEATFRHVKQLIEQGLDDWLEKL